MNKGRRYSIVIEIEESVFKKAHGVAVRMVENEAAAAARDLAEKIKSDILTYKSADLSMENLSS